MGGNSQMVPQDCVHVWQGVGNVRMCASGKRHTLTLCVCVCVCVWVCACACVCVRMSARVCRVEMEGGEVLKEKDSSLPAEKPLFPGSKGTRY